MIIPSSLLKKALKQAAVEVGKSAGSEIKSGVKEVADEKGKEIGKGVTESAVEQTKKLGQDGEYIIPVEDAMELLRETESELPDESEIDWTKEQLYQLSDQEFARLALQREMEGISEEDRYELVDSTPLDEKEPHTNYLVTVKDSKTETERSVYLKVTRHNRDITEGSPEILANSLFGYVKMYDIDPEGIAIHTQESVDEYFKLEAFSKYSIMIDGENTIRRAASADNIDQSDLG